MYCSHGDNNIGTRALQGMKMKKNSVNRVFLFLFINSSNEILSNKRKTLNLKKYLQYEAGGMKNEIGSRFVISKLRMDSVKNMIAE